MIRNVRFAFFAATVASLVASCNPTGTYVVLSFDAGPANVAKIHCDFTLGGSTATAQFAAKSGRFSFPTKGSVEIGKGAGTLTATCNALDDTGVTVGTVMGMVEVTRDKTTTLDLSFATSSLGDGGIGNTGALTILPAVHDYGVALTGSTSSPQVFIVTNTGTDTTGALAVALGADHDFADFSITANTCIGKLLTSKDSCTVTAVFGPQTTGATKSATLEVSAPMGTPGGTASAVLQGRAEAQGDLRFNENTAMLGSQLVGNAGQANVFTLTNGGTAASSVIAVSISGGDSTSFTKSEDHCDGTTLPGGGSCTLKVTFVPTARGALATTLSATAATGGTAVVNVSGTGQVAATIRIIGAASQSAPFDLGVVDVGKAGTTAHHVMIINDGDFPTGLLSIVAQPNTDFTPTALTTCNPGATVLMPGGSCVGDLVLMPASFGTKNIMLTASASPGGSASTFMTGVGQDHITVQAAVGAANGATGVVSDSGTPQSFNCGNGNTMCTKTFTRGATVPMLTLVASADVASYSVINNWTFTANAPPCTEGNPDTTTTCTVPLGQSVAANDPTNPYIYTANFKKKTFTITYQRTDYDLTPGSFGGDAGGLGALSSSNGFACAKGPCATTTETVAGGTTLTVTAKARSVVGSGKTLRRFTAPTCSTGTITSDDGSDATCGFTVSADTNVAVTFSAHNYAFVTSGVYTGNLGGLAGSTTTCQSLANAAHLPGTFISILSDSATDARDRITSAAGWIRVDGLPWAQDKATLFGQASGAQAINNWRIFYPLELDETGAAHTGNSQYVRTFTQAIGVKQGTTNHCVNWTSNNDAATTGQSAGVTTGGSTFWTDSDGLGSGCNTTMRLYCIGTDMITPVAPPAPPAGANKRVFLSNSKFAPGAGLSRADADSLCKNDAQAASLTSPNGWKSLLPTTTTTAASQAAPGNYSVVRIDGVIVGSSANVFSATWSWAAAIDQFATGGYTTASTELALTGAPNPAVNGTVADTCNNWGDGSGTARIGIDTDSAPRGYSFIGTQACSVARPVYCVEQ